LVCPGFKRIFTSPSLNKHEHNKNLGSSIAPDLDNAQLNGYDICYQLLHRICHNQVLFALSSVVLSQKLQNLDAVTFYNSILANLMILTQTRSWIFYDVDARSSRRHNARLNHGTKHFSCSDQGRSNRLPAALRNGGHGLGLVMNENCSCSN
ncbi:hypothetical protein Hypma_000984, partial [Hypsizygus marmoreus]